MRNFLSSERHKCLHLDDRVVKKVSKTNFGGITNESICQVYLRCWVYLRWWVYGERPMPPKSDAIAIRSAEPNERRKLFGEPTPSPQYLRWRVFGSCPSPRVYMGSAPCPQCQTLPLFGVPNPTRRRKLFGEPTPSPPYLRWCVFGRMPKPRGVYGERPMPPRLRRCAIWEVPSPILYSLIFLFFNFSLFQCYRTSTGTPRRSSDN